MKDWTFQAAFARMFVYNILFEDSEVDGQHLGVDDSSQILAISAAGCGVAGLLRFSPKSIDAVDINHHHLALAGLKMAAAQHTRNYNDFYDLLGRGWHADPQSVLRPLTPHLPSWVSAYWAKHHGRFRKGLLGTGLTARMLALFRRRAGVDVDWLRARIPETPEQRLQALRGQLDGLLKQRLVRWTMSSPLQLLALGVNFEQRDKLLKTSNLDSLAHFVARHLELLCATDLERNWYAWYGLAGQFNHDLPDAVPPYLRRASHAASTQSDTRVGLHHRGLFDVLAGGKPGQWSHYTLCDAVDWMPEQTQRTLFEEVQRTARPGARVLLRSVQPEPIPERLGFERFRRLAAASDAATRDDRSRQYLRVDFYEVAA